MLLDWQTFDSSVVVNCICKWKNRSKRPGPSPILLLLFCLTITEITVGLRRSALLTLPANFALQGLCNGRVSVRRSVCLSRRSTSAAWAQAAGSDRQLSTLLTGCRSIAASARAAAAGSVMLRAEVRGSTWLARLADELVKNVSKEQIMEVTVPIYICEARVMYAVRIYYNSR